MENIVKTAKLPQYIKYNIQPSYMSVSKIKVQRACPAKPCP